MELGAAYETVGSPTQAVGHSNDLIDFGGVQVSDVGINMLPPRQPTAQPVHTASLPAPQQLPTPYEAKNRKMLEIPQYLVNMAMDLKFNDDPFHLDLLGLITNAEYTALVREINSKLEACRATSVDHALLFSGTAMLPLIPWAVRNKKRKKKRRKLMQGIVEDFNREHPELYMRWETKPHKKLMLMRRSDVPK